MAALINAAFVLLTMLVLASLFENLPAATLGAVVIDAMVGLIELGPMRRYFRVNRPDWVFATAWILVIAAVVAAIALVTGPYRWAVALRRRTVSLARALTAAVSATATRRPDEPTVAWVAWVASHREALQACGIVTGILVLLVADLSWLGLTLLALLVAAFELALHRIADVTPKGSG